eukprot:18312-Rhodomonas_salina.2
MSGADDADTARLLRKLHLNATAIGDEGIEVRCLPVRAGSGCDARSVAPPIVLRVGYDRSSTEMRYAAARAGHQQHRRLRRWGTSTG